MSCHERTEYIGAEWARWKRWTIIAALLSVGSLAATLGAQTPVVPQPQSPQPAQPIMGYRSPAIALVQPGAGKVLAQDKAVLIFRFAQGESADPLDASSFAVWVNGSVRTASFQVGATEAWGPLSDSREVTPGAYQVTARICSTRGACGTAAATVTVASSATMPSVPTGESASRRQRVIDLVLAALRRLIGQ